MTDNRHHPAGLSALRHHGRRNYPVYVLSIPAAMGRALVEAGLERALFRCELTDEGILFRLASDAPEIMELPEWAKAKGEIK